MTEVIALPGPSGIFLGLRVHDSISTPDVVSAASLTLGASISDSKLLHEMRATIAYQTSAKKIQSTLISPSSVAIILYLHSDTGRVPDIDLHLVHWILSRLEADIRAHIADVRIAKKVAKAPELYALFEDPPIWSEETIFDQISSDEEEAAITPQAKDDPFAAVCWEETCTDALFGDQWQEPNFNEDALMFQ